MIVELPEHIVGLDTLEILTVGVATTVMVLTVAFVQPFAPVTATL